MITLKLGNKMVTIPMDSENEDNTLPLSHTQQETLLIRALRTEIATKMAKIMRAYKRWGDTEELNTLINHLYSAEARGIVDVAIRMHNMGLMLKSTLDDEIINYHNRLVTRITVWHNATKNS